MDLGAPSSALPAPAASYRPGAASKPESRGGSRDGASPRHKERIPVLEISAAVLTVILISLGAFQLHFELVVTAFVLFLVIVVTAMRLGFWQATFTSLVAVVCLDFFFTTPLYSLKTNATGLTALTAFELAALIVSRLSARVQLEAWISQRQRNNMAQLYALARNILQVNRNEPTGGQIVAMVKETAGVESVALFDSSAARAFGTGPAGEALQQLAKSAWLAHENRDEHSTHTWTRLLHTEGKPAGAIVLQGEDLSPIVVDAIASMAALALERSRTLEKETRAQAARQSEQLRTAVLDALAHAFKTPLTTIMAASSGLIEAGTLSPSEAELAKLIDEQSTVLNDLTTRLLQTARLAEEEIHLRREERTIEELIEDLLEPFNDHFRSRPAIVDIPDRSIVVTGDCSLIVTALRQLVDNAIKYSDPATPIRISAATVKDAISVTVHNHGNPILPDDRERIFDRFYRSSGMQHKAAGTGLGLSITRKVAEAHHGRVWVENDGDGPTFHFEFPLIPPRVSPGDRRPA
jgi:two-component system sensor histidine kinase KdpD